MSNLSTKPAMQAATSFKRQKFWHVQISAIFEGDLFSCDMKVEAVSAWEAYHICIRQAAEEIAASEENLEKATTDFCAAKAKIHNGVVFKRIVLVTNPAMMCAGGSGMRVAAAQDNGKKEILAKVEVKESERNKNYG